MDNETTAEIALGEGQEPKVEGVATPAEIKALQEKLEQAIKSQSGVDKTNAELSRRTKELAEENERLKKEKMSEREKAEYELAKRAAEIESKEREVKDATLRLSKMRLLGEKNIPIDIGDIIGGASVEEFTANLGTFEKHLERMVNERINAALGKGTAPQAGAEKSETPLPADWRELERKYQGR